MHKVCFLQKNSLIFSLPFLAQCSAFFSPFCPHPVLAQYWNKKGDW